MHRIGAPTAAPHDTLASRRRALWIEGHLLGKARVITGAEPIEAIFVSVAVHVVKFPCVGLQFADTMRTPVRIAPVPHVFVSVGLIRAPEKRCAGSGPAGIFPLRFRG